MNNGVCDAEILEDFDCLFDYPDCSDDLRKSVQCNFAVQQSYISCDIAIEMFLKYPSCEGIQLCCPDTRFDSLNIRFLREKGMASTPEMVYTPG